MESALAWIGQIAAWIGQWIPRWVILDTTMGAVKFVRGRKAVPLGPGVHFYWPVLTSLDTYPTARQTDDLRAQTVVTADGKTIVVGAQIIYEVSDILKLIPCTYRPAQAIIDITLTAVHDVICSLTWEELLEGQRRGTLDTKLRNSAQKQLVDYGVKVIKVQLVDLTPCRTYRLMTTNGELRAG